MKKTKNDYIKEYESKSKEWLVEKCASLQLKISKLASEASQADYERRKMYAMEHAARVAINENDRLKDILELSGIRPKLFEMEYLSKDCHNCKHADYSRCMSYGDDPDCGAENNYDGSECAYKNVTERVAFYIYTLDGDHISGIIHDFTESDFDLIKLTDSRTGEVLYEYKED